MVNEGRLQEKCIHHSIQDLSSFNVGAHQCKKSPFLNYGAVTSQPAQHILATQPMSPKCQSEKKTTLMDKTL